MATLRADFYDRPLRFQGFGAVVRDATVTVPAMGAAQLEATIRGPADRVGLEVEPPPVAELVAAVVHQPAATPSLQFTLYELAKQGDGRLDLAGYRHHGPCGVSPWSNLMTVMLARTPQPAGVCIQPRGPFPTRLRQRGPRGEEP